MMDILRIPAGVCLLATLCTASGQQAPVLVGAGASVTVLAPFSAGQTEPLAGDLQPVTAAAGGEVEVDPAKTVPTSPVKPAAYAVAGRRAAALALTLPQGQGCTLTAPGAVIPVKGFKVSVAGAPSTANPGGLTLSELGTLKFKVGATMVVPRGLPSSAYTGQFSVTLAYN